MTSPEVPVGVRQAVAPRLPKLSLSNWPVSRRLLALITVAVVMGVVFGGLRVAASVSTASSLSRTSQLADLGQQVTALAQAMEDERDLAAAVAAYQTVSAEPKNPTRAQKSQWAALQTQVNSQNARFLSAQNATSRIARQVRALAAGIGASFPQNTQEKATAVITIIDNLGGLRTEWQGQAAAGQEPQQAIQDYSAAIADLFAMNDEISVGTANAALSNDVHTLGALSRAKDQVSQIRAILYAGLIEATQGQKYGLVSPPPNPPPPGATHQQLIRDQALGDAGGQAALSIAQGLWNTNMIAFTSSATADELTSYRGAVNGPQGTAASMMSAYLNVATDPYLVDNSSLLSPALSGGLAKAASSRPGPVAATVWYANATSMLGLMRQNERQLSDSIAAQATVLRTGAVQSAELTAGVTGAVLILVLIATVLVARSLVNPLRRLQTDALEIAAVRLPAQVAAMAADPDPSGAPPQVEPIGVQSADEIGKVARAFDQVHAEALRLAGNEAAMRGNLNSMFISLSRRSVPLIDRLARMIDSMEQHEDNPDQLADLFSMDHLVTRMRRNSENLLVLAGEEPVRKWTEPVPLADVTRAAASEIEQYSRVLLAIQPGILVSGQTAADIVHLLAELIENATMFSPRDTQVQVNAQEVPTGGVLIEIRDNGVGVSASRLEEMNWRLDNPPLIDVSVSRHMGLFAVSRLAARHGVRVRLRPNTPQGLTALVWLPGHLLSQQAGLGGQPRAYGTETTHVEYGSPARRLAGRHRSEQPVLPGPGQPELARIGRRAIDGAQPGPAASAAPPRQSEWFRAKRPSSRDESWTAEEQPAAAWTLGSARATGGDVWEAAGWRSDGTAEPPARRGMPSQSSRTMAGLPQRVPRGGATAAADGYGGRGNTGSWAATRSDGPQVYSAQTDGYPASRDTASYRTSDQQRSPDTARSRLAGFQLGSREATGQTGSYRRPSAGEERGR